MRKRAYPCSVSADAGSLEAALPLRSKAKSGWRSLEAAFMIRDGDISGSDIDCLVHIENPNP